MSILDISRSNTALQFLNERIKHHDYRGEHLSQHNRYNMLKVLDILKLLSKYLDNEGFLTIRTTDITNRPKNNPDEIEYDKLCNEVKQITGIGTQDPLRKNLFVDFHRMGLIDRYNKKKEIYGPYDRGIKKFVSLTDKAKRLLKENDILKQYFLFSQSVNQLLKGIIDALLLIISEENNINYIGIYEYMFFVTALNKQKNHVTIQELISLIQSFRVLSIEQRKGVITTLKKELKPINYKGNKKNKRDFHNWKNESQQIFDLLGQTVYFEERDRHKENHRVVLRADANSFAKEDDIRLNRSLKEKKQYLKEHSIDKKIGFELHHIIPLSSSTSREHFLLLDDWKNMLYIDGYNHAKLTQTSNIHNILEFQIHDVILSNYSRETILLTKNQDVLYKVALQNKMTNYNKKLHDIKNN
ncbi:MAG: restriction endonuclease subunit R [Alphaproteobacteria bacterium]